MHIHRRQLLEIVFVAGICIVFFLNSTYRFFSSNDQLENIFGGRLITEGIFPYSGFFSQHMPFPHWLGAGLIILSHGTPWVYQILFTLGLCIWALWLYSFLRKHAGIFTARTFLMFITAGAILMRTNFLLAETLIAYASVTLIALLLYRYLKPNYQPTLHDAAVVSVLTFMIAGSSLMYVFFAVGVSILFLTCFIRTRVLEERWRAALLSFGVFLLPYAILALVILITHSARQFVFDVYTFNRVYYAPFTHYPQGVLHWIGALSHNFFNHIFTTFVYATKFLRLPDLLLTLGISGYLVILWNQRSFKRFAIIIAAAILLVPRIDFEIALNSTTDVFHGAPYFFVGALSVALVTQWLREHWGQRQWRSIAIGWFTLTSVTLAMLVSWAYFSLQFGLQNPDSRVNPSFSRVANSLLNPSDYFWSGPGIYPDILQTQARFGSRYLHFFPWQGQCSTCMEELLDDLTQTQPKLIVFESRGLIWQTLRPAEYVGPLLAYLRDHYYQLSGRYNPNGYLYFRNDVDIQRARQAVEQAAASIPAETIFD